MKVTAVGTTGLAWMRTISLILAAAVILSCGKEPENTVPSKPKDQNPTQTSTPTLPAWSSPDYKIVYNPDEDENRAYLCALDLAEAINTYYGVTLSLVASGQPYQESENEICIGGTPAAADYLSGDRDTFDYTVQVAGKKLVLAGACAWSLKEAVDVFIKDYISARNPVPADLKIEANCRGKRLFPFLGGANLRILDNNIWTYNKDVIPDAWAALGADPRNSFRSKQYAGIIGALLPDVFGWQEYDGPMQEFIEPMIAEKYAQALPDGRPARISTPLFYNKETVEPVVVHYMPFPGEFNDANSKSYTSGVFRHKPTGAYFIAVSTHLWWKGESSVPGSNAARTAQVGMIVNEVEDLLIEYDCPVFVMGDMNCNLSSEAMKVFTNAGYKDCGQSAINYKDSFKGHHTCSENDGFAWSPQQNDNCASAIDHIFEYHCGSMASVLTHRIITTAFTLSLTDHCPRYIDVILRSGGTSANPSAPAVELADAGTRILFIGNSFTQDAVEHLPGIVAASGFKDITMAFLYYGGRTIPEHNDWTKNDYTLYKSEKGEASWSQHDKTVSISQVAKAGRWDIVTLQEHTGNFHAWSWSAEEQGAIAQLLSRIKALQPSASFRYILSQAYYDMSKIAAASKPYISWTDQAGMWDVIAAQGRKVIQETDFEDVVSTGCALQNLRTSGLQTPMDLTRDGYHMDLGTSRYTAACTVYEKLVQPRSGINLESNTYRYNKTNYNSGSYTSPVTDASAPVCRKAAHYAVLNPYEVVDMQGEGASGSGSGEVYAFKGSGTEANPYLVEKAEDMEGISSALVQGSIKHFKMTSDIDMASVSGWTPVVTENKAYGLQFDGDGHVIRNFNCSNTTFASLFGLVYGGVKNLTLRDCSVSNDDQCALLAVWGGDGTGVCEATVSNVHAENCSVSMTGKTAAPVGGLIANGCRLDISGSSFHGTVSSSATSGSVYLGGLVGRISISGVTISRCFVDADVIASGGSQIGGLAGSCANGCSVSISDCYTKGALKGKGSYIGGIVGDLTVDSSVQRCYSTMPISGVYNHGGIVGRASNLSNPYSKHTFETPMNICVAKCIAWNPSIATTGSGENPNSHYSSGAVVGFTVWKNPLSECFRRPDMSFSVYANPEYNVLTDNDDVSPEHLLVRPSEDTYHCPYNGKAAAAGQTVSSLAAALGWSPSVWDMSADLPVLR